MRAVRAMIGQRFTVEVLAKAIVLRPVPESFAGTLAGVFGSVEDAQSYVDGERAAWDYAA